MEESPEDLEAKGQVQTGARGDTARMIGPQAVWETEK